MFYLKTNITIFIIKYYEYNIYYNSLLHTQAGVCGLQFEE